LDSGEDYKYRLIDSDERHKGLNEIALCGSILLLLKLATIYVCTCSHHLPHTRVLSQELCISTIVKLQNLPSGTDVILKNKIKMYREETT
jgi:hypothetical protein